MQIDNVTTVILNLHSQRYKSQAAMLSLNHFILISVVTGDQLSNNVAHKQPGRNYDKTCYLNSKMNVYSKCIFTLQHVVMPLKI